MSKTLTLKQLKELEQKEYETLHNLDEYKLEARNDKQIAESLMKTIRYQRGKWAMLCDLIDMMEEDNEQ